MNILSWILKYTIPALMDVPLEDIRRGIEDDGHGNAVMRDTVVDSRKGSTITMDSHFRISLKVNGEEYTVLVGIEGQNDPHPGYPLEYRMQYYASRLLSNQKTEGGHYEVLKPVYSIWIMPYPLEAMRDTVSVLEGRWRFTSRRRGESPPEEFALLINIVAIYLGTEGDTDILEFLEPIFKGTRGARMESGLEEFRKKYMLKPEDITLEKVEEMCGIAEDSRVRYTREGIELGEKTGDERRMKIEKIDIISRLVLDEGWTFERALKFAQVPDEHLEFIISESKKRIEAARSSGSLSRSG